MQEPNHQTSEHHVLVINDGKTRAIALDAAAYSIGRDHSNAIVLDVPTVSRQHAILLRLPIPNTNRYRYRLIDGNSEGKQSANGVFVNGKKCTSYELAKGDTIRFGLKVQASYLTVAMGDAEFVKYLESTRFHRLKSEVIDHKATLVAAEMSGPLPVLAGRDPIGAAPPPTVAKPHPPAMVSLGTKLTSPGDTIPEIDIFSINANSKTFAYRCRQLPRLWMTAIPVVVIGMALAAWLMHGNSSSTGQGEASPPATQQTR
jgi:pSer/pThr/pTyr-binding forkhead associated (FHA) protein